MKLFVSVFTCFILMSFISVVSAQEGGASPFKNDNNSEYPIKHPDLSVTFSFHAPNAELVQLNSGGCSDNNGCSGLGVGPIDMTKDADGNWTVTIPPGVPGFYWYSFNVDGVRVPDPACPKFPGNHCAIDLPGPGEDFYFIKDVPHGVVRIQPFYSEITQSWRRAYIYTPPGYDQNPDRRYPVLYLQHGAGDDEEAWTGQGQAQNIMDNLLAAGEVEPMIIVMNNGYALKPGEPSPRREPVDAPSTLEEVFMQEIIPMIDRDYRTIADQQHRAIAGASMGSGHAMQIGFRNVDTFSHFGIFSRPPRDPFDIENVFGGLFADADSYNEKVSLFYWSAGAEEPLIYQYGKDTTTLLNAHGIPAIWTEYEGLAHQWGTFRKQLYDFLPRLFKG